MDKNEIIAELKARLESEPNAMDTLNVLAVKMGMATHHVFTPTFINQLIEVLKQ